MEQKSGILNLKDTGYILLWCLGFAVRASTVYTIMRMAVQLFAPIASVVIAFCGRYIINILANGGDDDSIRQILLMMTILLAAEMLLAILERADRHVRMMHDECIDKEISDMLMLKALECGLSEYDDPSFYDAMTIAERNTYVINQMIWNAIQTIGALYSFLLTFTLLSRSRLYYGVLMVISVLPSTVISVLYTRGIYRLQLDHTLDERKAMYSRQVSFDRTFAQQIRIFDIGKLLREKYTAIWNRIYKDRRRMSGRFAVAGCVAECLPEIVSVVIGIDISLSVLRGEALVGDYSLYIGLLAQLGVALQTLIGTVVSMYDNRIRMDSVMKLEKLMTVVDDNGTENLEHVDSITFRDVSFSYPGTNANTLSHISFHIISPEKVCITGHNGSGKSTLIKLLLRLYEPTEGEILINQKNIRSYTLQSLREAFSIYLQEMKCFMYSIRDNFLMVDPLHPEADSMMYEALEKTGCSDIMKIANHNPDVCLSKVFDRHGIELSAGQYQKLSVARAFFRRFEVFIMDEPSSNLDSDAERRIFETVHQYAKDRIVICVSHRPEAIHGITRLLRLDGGYLTES